MARTAGPATRRRAAERRGRRAEGAAALWLRLKGYRLLDRRVRTPVGEIDLVLRRGGTIVFAEVKQRRDAAQALTAVTPAQQRRIIRAARWWLMRNPRHSERPCRFDLVVVSGGLRPHHIPNAWMAGD